MTEAVVFIVACVAGGLFVIAVFVAARKIEDWVSARLKGTSHG